MGPDRPTSVLVDGHELNGVDGNGVVWKFIAIEGWHSGPGTAVPQTQRIVSHGQFGQPGHRTGKTLTIRGSLEAADRTLIPDALDTLAGILADGQFGTFQFTDRTQGSRHTRVQLLDAPDVGAWDGSQTARYQLQLLAPDPYKYGSVSSSSTGFGATPVGSGLVFALFPAPNVLDFGAAGSTGVVTLTNAGNAPSAVKFTVTGPTPSGGFVITDAATGKPITFLGTVPTGSTLVLDGSDGSVTIDGSADRLGDTIVTAWPTIAPGDSRDFLFSPLGGTSAAVLTASTTATYW